MEPSDYWRKVCAPKVRARKEEIGRALTNTEIGAYVEAATGKPSGRALVESWFKGEREPFVSQLLALCERLELDPFTVLASPSTQKARTVVRVQEGKIGSGNIDSSVRKRTQG